MVVSPFHTPEWSFLVGTHQWLLGKPTILGNPHIDYAPGGASFTCLSGSQRSWDVCPCRKKQGGSMGWKNGDQRYVLLITGNTYIYIWWMLWYVVKYSMIHVVCIQIIQIIQIMTGGSSDLMHSSPSSAKITFRHALPSKPCRKERSSWKTIQSMFGKEWSQTFLIGIRKEGVSNHDFWLWYDMVGYMNCFDLLRVKTQFQSAKTRRFRNGRQLEPSEKSARPLRTPPKCGLYICLCLLV